MVYISNNSAQSFTQVAIPTNTNSLNSIACPTRTNCIAVGLNSIIYTTDGGLSWNSSSSFLKNVEYNSVTCISPTNCIVVGSNQADFRSNIGVIISSNDNGKTFSQDKYLNNISALDSIACSNQSDCIAVGGIVLVSSDSGKSWNIKPVPDGIDNLSSISCLNTTTCIAVGPNSLGMGDLSVSANAIYTTDSGTSFSHISLGINSAFVNSIACNLNSCIAIGPNLKTNGSTVEFNVAISPNHTLGVSQINLIPPGTLLTATDSSISEYFYGLGSIQHNPVIYKINQNSAVKVGN